MESIAGMMTRDRQEEQIRAVLDMIAKDEAAAGLDVRIEGNAITVSKIGTDFSVTYEKRPDNPHLVLARSWTDQRVTTPAVSEFRARAFQASPRLENSDRFCSPGPPIARSRKAALLRF
jgi:hypothetical protein